MDSYACNNAIIRNLFRSWPGLTLTIILTSGCGSPVETDSPDNTPQIGKWGVELEHLSSTLQPGDDFYRYINQGWLDSATIPEGLPYNGSFVELSLRVEEQMAALVAALESGKADDTAASRQLKALYDSYLDQEQRDSAGLQPLATLLAKISSAKNHDDITRLMAQTGFPSVIGTMVLPDPQHPGQYTLALGQDGLGLPDRDYYLTNNSPYPAHREAYQNYIASVLRRAGNANPEQQATKIMAFETRIAEAHWTASESRNVVKLFHAMPLEELKNYAPGFNWNLFLTTTGAGNQESYIVANDSALQKIAALFSDTPVSTLQVYSQFHLLNNFAPYLGSDWEQAHFAFFSTQLKGIKQPRSKQKRALALLNQMLSEELGKAYVKAYFPESSKEKMQTMIGFIRQSFDQHIRSNDWMDETTRKAAYEKLHAFGVKIAYPDQWHDRSSISLSNSDLPGNLLAIMTWLQQDSIEKLNGEYRDWEWEMSPQTVNAYYTAMKNEIVFPAAILQPPFFDPNADPAVNFGSIGMVIGHEMGHGFDDQGSRFDAHGQLRNWWTDSARIAFDEKANELVEQYNQYSPIPGVFVNGQLTLGENIGDMTGISIAWTAWKKYEEAHYPEGSPVLDGYTGDQRFFMGFAQLWRSLKTDEITRQLALSDNHSPGEFRVNGILRNFSPWYQTYSVRPDQALYLNPENRIRIW